MGQALRPAARTPRDDHGAHRPAMRARDDRCCRRGRWMTRSSTGQSAAPAVTCSLRLSMCRSAIRSAIRSRSCRSSRSTSQSTVPSESVVRAAESTRGQSSHARSRAAPSAPALKLRSQRSRSGTESPAAIWSSWQSSCSARGSPPARLTRSSREPAKRSQIPMPICSSACALLMP